MMEANRNMTVRERATVLFAAGTCMVLLALAPLRAHHSMAMYEQKNITISGVVKRVDLRNPHSLFYITVTDAQGNPVEWVLEAQPLSTLMANGWSATTMKVGEKVTAAGAGAEWQAFHARARVSVAGRPHDVDRFHSGTLTEGSDDEADERGDTPHGPRGGDRVRCRPCRGASFRTSAGPRPGAAPTRGCNLPEPFPCPVARLVDLTAEPAMINPGEAARITWAAETRRT